MLHLIDKDALVAELWKRRNEHFKHGGSPSSEYCHEDEEIYALINTLEVKEVDLDNELDFVKDAYYYFTSDERSSMKKVARHFIELGLKMQKGE